MRTLLCNKRLHYHRVQAKSTSDLEDSLLDHIAIDNLDENNKFVCDNCTKKRG